MSKDEGKTKIAGVYRVREPIENLKIRVKVVQQTSLLDELLGSHGDARDPNFLESEERIFSWQRKVLSPFESEFYAEENNCVTEAQKNYHRLIRAKNIEGSRLFCYTQNDSYGPDEGLLVKPYSSILSARNESALPAIPNRKPFAERFDKRVVDRDKTLALSNHYLYAETSCMHILADLSRIEEPPTSSRPDCHILLCTLAYDSARRILTVFPDFSGERGYAAINESAVKYDYWIEHVSEGPTPQENARRKESAAIALERQRTENEATLYRQLHLSPPNTLRIFLSLEIARAHDFPYDGLYVAYCVDLPRHWLARQNDKLSGRTQRSQIRDNKAHFAHLAHFTLDRDFGNFSNGLSARWPCLFLAVSSLDKWTRYRTEGYASLPFPVHPGSYKFTVRTWRAAGGLVDRLRRFFTGGGSYELEDISYCSIPSSQSSLTLDKSNLRIVPSGSIEINMNFVHQSRPSVRHPSSRDDRCQKSDTHELMRSVEDVFERFKAARERMIKVRAEGGQF